MVEAVGKVVSSLNAKASLASESPMVFGTATKEPACAALNQVAFPVFMQDALRVDAP